MKKFIFQLDTLYKIKTTLRDKLQTEYAEAETALGNAVRRKERLEKEIDDESATYEARAKKGMTVSAIRLSSTFLEELGRLHRTAVAEADRARQNAEQKRSELLGVFQDIKALEKLREKQYEEYLADEEKRETNRIEDIISFSISEKSVNTKAAL
jgi:flagellar FliJ protein